MSAKEIIKILLTAIILAVIIIVILVTLLVIWAKNNYNKMVEEMYSPIKYPETYEEFVYIKPTYEKYKDYVNIHQISSDSIISFTIDIDDNADADTWLGIVSGFAKDINKSSQPITIIFHSGIRLPYYIEISNCECISKFGQTRMLSDNKNVCFIVLETNDGKYNPLDIISALNAEYIYLGNQSYIDRDRQAFADTINNTNAQRLIVLCHFYDEDSGERKSEYQQTLQSLLPNIQVFCQ